MTDESETVKTEGVEPRCWEIVNCSEVGRSTCPAWKAGKSCWEVEGTPLDSDDRGMCETCPVILSRIAHAIARAMSEAPLPKVK